MMDRQGRWIALLLVAVLFALSASPAAAQDASATRWETSDPAAIGRLIAEIEARPESVDPFEWALVSSAELGRGNMLRASFWFYMFQARSRPWARADDNGSGAAALRGSLNEVLGTQINRWIFAEPELLREVAGRAIAYEARLPLHPARPEGMDEAAWLRLVATERAAYAKDAREALDTMNVETLAKERRANGLFVGRLTDRGAALPDHWR